MAAADEIPAVVADARQRVREILREAGVKIAEIRAACPHPEVLQEVLEGAKVRICTECGEYESVFGEDSFKRLADGDRTVEMVFAQETIEDEILRWKIV